MMHVAGSGPVFSPRGLESPLALIDSCVPDLPGRRPEDGPSTISSQMLRVYPTPRVDQDLSPNELERPEDPQDQQQRLQPDEYLQAPAQAPLSQRENNSRYGPAGTRYQDQSSYVNGMNRNGNRQPQPTAFQNPFGSPYYRHAVQAAAPISAMPMMGPMTAALYQRQLANAQQNWAPTPACSYGGAMAPMYGPLTSNIMMGPAACASLEFSPLQANLMANPRASYNGRTGDSTPRTSISDIRPPQQQVHHHHHHHQTPAQVPAPVPAHTPGPFCLPTSSRRSSQGQYPSLGGWANAAPQQARPPSVTSAGGPPACTPLWPSSRPKSPADSPLTSCLFGRRWRGGSSAAAAQPQPMPPPGVGFGGYHPHAPAGEQGPHPMPSRFRPSTASSVGGGNGVGGASFCPPGQLQAVPQAYPRYHRQANWPPAAPRPPLPPTPASMQVATPMQPPAQAPTPTQAPAHHPPPQRKVSFVDGPGMVTQESRHLRPMPAPSPIPEYQATQPQAQAQAQAQPYHYLHQRFPPPNPTVRQRQLQQQQQQQQARQENEQPRPTPSQPQQVQQQQQQQAQQQQVQAQQQWQAQQQMQAQATQQLLQAQQQMQQIQWQAQQLTAQAQLIQAQQAQQWLRDQHRLQAQQRVRELQLEERGRAGASEAAQRKMLSSVKMPCWMRREVRMRMAAENEIQPTVEELTMAAPPPSMAVGGLMMAGMPVVTEPSSGGAGGGGCMQPWLSRALSRSPSPQRARQPSARDSMAYVPSSSRDFTTDSSQRPSPQASSLSPRSSSNRVLSARESQSALSAASESRSPVAAAMAKAAAKAASCFSPGRSRSVISPRGRTTEDSVAAPPAYSPGGRAYHTTDGSPLHPIEMDLFSTQPFGARLTEPHGIGMEERGSNSNSSKQWWCGLTCSNGKEGDDIRTAKGTAASSCGGTSTIASRFDSLIFPEDSVPEGDGVATAAAEAAAAAVAAVAAALTMDAADVTPKADATAAVAAEDAAAAVAAVEAALCGETPRSAPVAERAVGGTPSGLAVALDATAAVAAADAVAAVAAVEAALAAVNAAGVNVVADNEQAAEAVETAVAAVEAALAVVNAAGTNIAADSAAAAVAVEDAVAAVAAALQAVSMAGGGAVVSNPNAVAAVENTAAAAAAVQAALAGMGTASASADAGAAVTAAAAAESTTAAVEAALAAISLKSASSGGASDGKGPAAEGACGAEPVPADGAEEGAAEAVPETDGDAAASGSSGDGEIVPADNDDATP